MAGKKTAEETEKTEVKGLNKKDEGKKVTTRTITEGDYILKGDVKVGQEVTIPAGKKFDMKREPVLVRKLMDVGGESMTQTGNIFTLTKALKINKGTRIPKGTVLVESENKDLIETLKKENPHVLGIEEKVKEVTIVTKDKAGDDITGEV